MTIVAALNIKSIFGIKINEILICGDSRVTRDAPRNELNSLNRKDASYVASNFDSAQKVIPVASNILIGFAGDYRIINLIEPLKSYLMEIDPSDKENYKRSISILKNEIRSFIYKNFLRDNWASTDILIVIKDFKTNVKGLYKLVLPDNIFVKLNEGLHVIGDSAQTRSDFKEQFEFNKNEIFKYNQGQDLINILSVSLGTTLENFHSSHVGGRFHCFVMKNSGWVNIGTAQLYDEANSVVATALGENGITTQLNGIEVEKLTSDYTIVNSHLTNHVKSVLRNEKDS